ncbi:MAG: hypothetical protein KatS3mg058_3401 [Roseiflexus sp.]|nr:MAG: hypothetical protein KatS3mg058_3401 [Roseiflexus sp.]
MLDTIFEHMRTLHSIGTVAVIGAIALATACLTGGLIVAGETLFALASAALGGVWVAGVVLQRRWTRVVALPGMLIVAVGTTFVQVAPFVSLAGLVMTLVAWNLDDLERRLNQAGHIVDEHALRRIHTARLLLVAGASLGVGGVASVVRFEIGAIGALILGALAVLGLSRIVTLLRRMTQDWRQ